MDVDFVSRTDARIVRCPYCGAGPEYRCFRLNGQPRESNHLERVERFKALFRR